MLTRVRNLSFLLLFRIAALLCLTCVPSVAATNTIGEADGSFESGLTGFVTAGDVQTVPSHAILFPTEGNRALLMTTKPDSGLTPSDAQIARLRVENFAIDAQYRQIRFDYDFLTKEPTPSRTNDRFRAELVLVTSGGTETLLTVDTYQQFHPLPFSEYKQHTGFRSMVADVSAHAGTGELVTLELRVQDVGDGRNDSAVFVDNLRLVESGAPVARANVDYLEVAVDQVIDFDGRASTDDGTIVEYIWDFGDGTRGFGPRGNFAYSAEGVYQGTLTVTDDDGLSDTATFTVVVGDPNHAPTILSTPVTTAREGIQYVYPVVAHDPELVYGDTLTFSLTQAPAGMRIDPATGRIRWIPERGAPTTNPVTVRVVDSLGLFDEQSFTVTIDNSSFIIVTDDNGRVYYARSNGDGTWADFRQIVTLPGTIRGAAIADFDNDGDWDFVVPANPAGNTLDFHLFLNNGMDQFEHKVTVASSSAGSGAAYGMSSGDLNHDGNMDFIVSRAGLNVVVGLGNGKGGFAVSEFNTGLADGRALDVADFDHDGHLDFVRARYSTGEIHLWRGNGQGGFTNAGLKGDPGTDPYGVPAADFNNDGHPDFIGNQGSAGDPYFYPGNGNGTFGSAVYVGSLDFNNYGKFDNYDFNRDGNEDLITVSYNSLIVRYYPGNGNGTFGAAVRVNPSNTLGNILGVAAPPGRAPVGDPIPRISPDFVVDAPGATIAFSASDSTDDGTIVSYTWDFGDGQTGSGINVSHTFPNVEDEYVVRLTVRDNMGRFAVGTALVRLAGAPPVADAGGAYVFGEAYASGGAYTVTLDGTGSSDDGPAPLEFKWDLGNGLDGPFTGDTFATGVWASGGATLDGFGSAIVTGAGNWGDRYLVSNRQYSRRAGDSYTGRVLVRSGAGNRYVMWGLKDTGTNYSYTQFYYAIYFNNGTILIYESGNNRGTSSYTFSDNVSYDVRIDVKNYEGATYYIRRTGTSTWTQIYDSSYSTATVFRVGATVHSGTIEFTDFESPHETSTAARPTVTYAGPGVYDVALTVTDGVGLTDSDTTTVTIEVGEPPVSNPGSPVAREATANCGQWTVSFDGRGSTDDRGIFRYEWDFGDGGKATGPTTTHTYTIGGTYTVTLTVYDNALQKHTATTTVVTTPQNPPVANPGGPYTVDERVANAGIWTASFSGAASTDDFGICDYKWTFGDGGTATGPNPTHQYAAAGVYTVTLTVRDHALQSHTASTTITVTGSGLPVANPGGPYTADEHNALNGLWTITLDGRGSTDDFGIWTWAWDFGDGGTGTGSTPTHVYSAPGIYTVSLTVTDNGRQTNTAQTQVTVRGNQLPVAEAGPAIVTEIGRPVTLDATGSTDDFGIFRYQWHFDLPPLDDFSSGQINPAVWATGGATASNGEAVVTGAGSWGNRYLVTNRTFTRAAGDSYTGRIRVDSGGDRYVMWGLKDTGTNYSYTQFYYAIYFHTDGRIRVYESGTDRGVVGSYANDTSYDVRIDVETTGAKYFVRPAGTATWSLIYDSGYSAASSFRLGATIYAGVIHLDDFAIGRTTERPVIDVVYDVAGTYHPSVTVTDHALQTHTDATTVTVLAGSPPVADGGETYTTNVGFPTRFDASGSTDDFGIKTYAWSFGDGESLTTRNSWVDHVYTSAGTYNATVTVSDYAGRNQVDTMAVTVIDAPVVVAVPWGFVGATEVRHDVVSGRQATLKAVAWSQRTPLTYTWDFGDGTPPMSGTVSNLRAIETKHAYTGVEGRTFDATITVTDANGRTASDTYRMRIASTSLHTEINLAIDQGLWRLHKDQMQGTFSQGTFGNARIDHGRWDQGGGWPYDSRTGNLLVGPTASGVQAFEVNGHFETGDVRRNPYVETVARGLRYLPYLLQAFVIDNEPYGDPDTNGNGIGIDTRVDVDDRPAYELGQAMDCLIASGSRDTYTITGYDGVIQRTYRDLVVDMVDAYAWGQYDSATVGGGWRYPGWNQHPDNSVVQWGAIGMIPAERLWSIEIPQFVKDRLNVWLNYSYNGTGFGYTGAGNDRNTTPSGLVELAFLGVTAVDDPGTPQDERDRRWATAENYIANNWNGSFWYPNAASNNRFSYYAYYAFTKAMRLARPSPIVTLRATGLDWFFDDTRGIARRLINRQGSDGGWPLDVNPGGTYVGYDLTNAWSVIMLQALFEVPPVANAGPDRVWGVNVEITLDGCDSYHPDSDRGRRIILYEWDLDGDGVYDTSGPDCTVTHTYTSQDYPDVDPAVAVTVRLRVSDDRQVDGVPAPLTDTDSAIVTLTLPPHPPVADPDGPYLATAGIPVALDGSGSFDINPTDFITAWEWDLDNDGAYDDALGERPAVIFDHPTPPDQPATIGLRVLDNGVLNDLNGNGQADPEERLEGFGFTEVTVIANTVPVANAGGPYVVNEGSSVRLDGSASSDPESNPITYAWDFDGDGIYDDAVGVNPDFAGVDDGVYPVGLEVSDTLLTDTASTQVTVNNVAPNLAPIPNGTVLDDPAVVGGSFTDPGVRDTHSATIDWGEGAGPVPATVNQGAGSGTIQGNHVYAEDGVYQVTVTVTDDDGGVDIERLTLTVERNDPPVADAGGPYVVNEGGTITVSAAASFDPNVGDQLTYVWDLDADGIFETPGLTPTFSAAGRDGPDTQQVSVRVTDQDGESDVDSATVTIENVAPTADAGGPYAVVEGGAISVSATGTDPGPDSLTYAWDLDGDGTFETPGQTVTFSAAGRDGPDNQTIAVQVTDDDGAATVDSATVTIENAPPTADAGGPYTVVEGSSITVSATTGTDAGGDTLIYAWDLDGDGTFETPGQSVTFSAAGRDGPDTQVITVQVTDDDGASTVDSATVTIENAPPAVEAGGPYAVPEGGSVSVSATATDAGGDGLIYAWDLDGDGTFETAGQSVTFSAVGRDGPDTQGIAVRVTDDDGASSIATATVNIENVAPTADAGGPYTVPEGGSVPVSATASDVGGDGLTYAWDLDGDGTFETPGQSVTFSAVGRDGPDTQVISVQVTDDDGASTVDSAAVTIENAPPVVDAGGPYAVPEGGAVAVSATATDAGGDGLVYAWDLDGDGTFETAGQSVTFSAVGRDGPDTQGIAVRVTDDDGASSIGTATVNIENVAPTADAGGPYTVPEGGSVPVSATASDVGGDGLTYAWDLDGDGTFETPGQSVTFSAVGRDGPDTQMISVQVTDDDGASAIDSAAVDITNVPPTVDAGGPYTVAEGGAVPVSATGADVGGDTLSYAWDLDGNGTFETQGQSLNFSAVGHDGPGTHVISVRVTDDDGASAVDSATVTIVNVAPLLTLSATQDTVQYSDPIEPFTITAIDVPQDALVAATSYSVNGGVFVSGLPNGLTLSASSSPGSLVLTLAGIADVAPGRYVIQFTVTDDDGASASASVEIVVVKEDARAVYSGPSLIWTPSVKDGTVTVNLRATIRDISAVTGDPATDPNPGDIRNATVRFQDEKGTLLCAAPLVSLVFPGDTTVGSANCNYTVTLANNEDARPIEVTIVVNNYYTDTSDNEVVIIVSRPGDGFITGGGYLINTDSAGSYAGAVGRKSNFGFNAQSSQKGGVTQLKGRTTIIVRADNGHKYKIKSNALLSLGVNRDPDGDGNSTVEPYTAQFEAKANLTDDTDTLHPISIKGNLLLQLRMTDNGEPGANDTISFTLWDGGTLFFSSHWNGAQSIEQRLDGGNLQVH